MNSRDSPSRLPRYDVSQTYEWNYANAPEDSAALPPVPAMPGEWTFCDQPVASPLGIAAGPLLNGAWCRYYARLGFDVVTYKTVRSQSRRCYPPPNLTFVNATEMTGREEELSESSELPGEQGQRPRQSWAVSYGMPSQSPKVWQKDIRETKEAFASSVSLGQRTPWLNVSVVASVDGGQSTSEMLASDYASTAAMAVEAGADSVEANFSCPNVTTCDGQLYQDPVEAGRVARRIRDVIDDVPLLIKIGHELDRQRGAQLMAQLAPHVNAVVMTNSVASRVRGVSGDFLFDGQRRGICGAACRQASLAQVRWMQTVVEEGNLPLRIIGVGGIFDGSDVQAYLDAGAEAVQLATAAMLEPAVGLKIRENWANSTVE